MYLRKLTLNLLGNLKRLRIPTTHYDASSPFPLSSKVKYQNGSRGDADFNNSYLWTIMLAPAVFLGANANAALADAPAKSSPETDSDTVGLRKLKDGSVISNLQTSKWRVFTDSGRDFLSQGKLDKAESLFLSALREAKEGFGERDLLVASACNNLADLYREQKAFDKAEPLYFEAINILAESLGPEDIRLGSALHNLGHFYLLQRKLDKARKSFEQALKIKGRVLGHNHLDYADTMYHLGMVLFFLRKNDDAEALIQDSIRILEDGGQGQSIICVKRLQRLFQIYAETNNIVEAQNVQRKVLHIMELSQVPYTAWEINVFGHPLKTIFKRKGWNSMDTVLEGEILGLLLLSTGNFQEAQELLERCLDARKTLLPKEHIQIGANMLDIARAMTLNLLSKRNESDANLFSKADVSEAMAEVDKAKDLLMSSERISKKVLMRSIKANMKKNELSEREGREALVIWLRSLDTLSTLAMKKSDLQRSEVKLDDLFSTTEAEIALSKCISIYKLFEDEKYISDAAEVKDEYITCLKSLERLLNSQKETREIHLQLVSDEIKRKS